MLWACRVLKCVVVEGSCPGKYLESLVATAGKPKTEDQCAPGGAERGAEQDIFITQIVGPKPQTLKL